MTDAEIATADIDTINGRQDAIRGDAAMDRERSELELRREHLAEEHYGPTTPPFDRPIREIVRNFRRPAVEG